MASKIQNRRDTSANWEYFNIVLAKGEIGLEADSMRFKWGDGVTNWNSLPYAVNTLLTGMTAPSSSVGKDGDCYIDVSVYMFYGPKANGTWDDGISLITNWLHGNTAPTSELGVDRDYYINTSTSDLYFKSAGEWSLLVNIKGLKGDTGNGIASIQKQLTNVLVDSYRVDYTDGGSFSYNITNGKGVSTISKTGATGLTDTYTITYNDNTTTTYTIANGRSITSISGPVMNGLVGTYTINYNDGTTSTYNVTNGCTWYSGSETPSNATGIDGDFFLNNVTYDVLKRVAGVWSAQTNIKGLKGDTGSGYKATSSSAITVSSDPTTFTTQSGLAYSIGGRVRLTSTINSGVFIEGVISDYTGTSMTVVPDVTSGNGTFSSWNINTAGQPGGVANSGTVTNIAGLIKGSSGALAQAIAGADYSIPSYTINVQTGTSYTLVSSDNDKIVTVSNASPITITLSTAAGLGVGWNVRIINVGTSVATINRSGSDTIDGIYTSFALAPNNSINLVANTTGSFVTFSTSTNNPLIKGYREACLSATITTTFDFTSYVGQYTSFSLTATAGSNITFTMPPISNAGESLGFQLLFKQSTPAVTITWGGTAPTFISGAYTAPISGKAQILVFTSINGSPWYASIVNSADI